MSALSLSHSLSLSSLPHSQSPSPHVVSRTQQSLSRYESPSRALALFDSLFLALSSLAVSVSHSLSLSLTCDPTHSALSPPPFHSCLIHTRSHWLSQSLTRVVLSQSLTCRLFLFLTRCCLPHLLFLSLSSLVLPLTQWLSLAVSLSHSVSRSPPHAMALSHSSSLSLSIDMIVLLTCFLSSPHLLMNPSFHSFSPHIPFTPSLSIIHSHPPLLPRSHP